MRQVLQVCAYLFGVPLELMVIAALLRGEYRRYPFIFLYAVVDLLTTILEIQPSMAYDSLAVFLALVAGYLDGYGLLVLGTYVSFMSGNTTFAGLKSGQGNF